MKRVPILSVSASGFCFGTALADKKVREKQHRILLDMKAWRNIDMKKIAVYGKGGIGKSTTTANMAAALADMNLKVMQIGCDPKADSTQLLMRGVKIPSVLDRIKEQGENIRLEDITFSGYGGIVCVESGGPTPGIGCAGRGIITAFNKLEELHAYQVFQPDVVLYDVLGDVVCGGFAMPIRDGYADEVLIVTSGERMALFAASNIVMAIENFKKRQYATLRGVIQNSRNIENENKIVSDFVESAGTTLVQIIPRDRIVQSAEELDKTVVEAFPDSEQTKCYRELARKVIGRDVQ